MNSLLILNKTAKNSRSNSTNVSKGAKLNTKQAYVHRVRKSLLNISASEITPLGCDQPLVDFTPGLLEFPMIPTFTHYDDYDDISDFSLLRPQSLMCGFIETIINKLTALWGEGQKQAARLFVMNNYYTFAWVYGRLARVTDWYDILSIIDYVTRIHFGQPAGGFIFGTLFTAFIGTEAQSMDWSALRDLTTSYSALKTHPAVIKFLKVISLAFSGGVLASLGIEAKAAQLWELVSQGMTKIIGHTDFISAVIDLFHFIGERLAAFAVTGDWKVLLHTPTNYAKWADKCYDLLDKLPCLANPGAVGLDYHGYLHDLSESIQQGEEIKKYLRSADEKDAVSQLLHRLKTLYSEILIKDAAGKTRMAPYAILLSAGSGVAKSMFTAMLIIHYAKLYNKPLDDEFIYTRCFAEEHWNGFKSVKWACIFDDIASINPNTGSDDPSLRDVLAAIGNFGFSPPQAALEDKGKTPFLCELIVASTNTENLKAHNWFNNPQAIRRRFPYVVNMLPKEEYRLQGSNMIDTSKIPPTLQGHYPDLWDITVKYISVDKDENIQADIILETSNVYEFITNYNRWLDDHRNSQAAFLASKKASADVTLCDVHRIPLAACGCDPKLVPQVGTVTAQGAVASVAVGGITAYSTFKTAAFAAECVTESATRNPDINQSPLDLLKGAAVVAQEKIKIKKDFIINGVKMYAREQMKELLRNGLYNVYQVSIPFLKQILGALGILAGMGLTWKLLTREIPELTSELIAQKIDIDNVGVMPEKKQEKENVWRKDTYVPSEFIGRLSTSWSALELTKAASLIAKNAIWCETTHKETKHARFRALCVGGHLYVVPHHVLPNDEYFMMQVIHDNDSEGCNGNIKFKIAQNRIYRRPDLELAFFEINHMPVRRNIMEALPKKGFQCDAPGRMVVRNANGSLEYIDTLRSNLVQNANLEQFNIYTDAVASRTKRDTMDGECGCPLIVKLPNACIVAGIHVLGGRENLAIAVPVTQDVVNEAIEFYHTPIVETSIPNLEGQNFSTNISERCTARFIQDGAVNVFGSFNSFKQQPKSTACDTLFTPHLLSRGHVRKFGPAPMKGYTAVHLALKPMVQKPFLFKEDVLRKCTNNFLCDIKRHLPKKYLQELRNPLPLKVALNGMPGTKFIDSMNFSTSAGFPHNSTKRNFISKIPGDDIWQEPVVVCDEIKTEIENIWDNMLKGISSAPIFMQHLKDEALPLRKVKAGKARVFMGGPFAWSVCVRMLLLPFIRVMQLNKYLFECAPGTNTTSIEWTRLYKYLTKFGTDCMIAGDFETFDKLMGALVILEAFRLIRDLMQYAGASDEYLRAVQVVAEDTAFAFVNYNGDLMQFLGSNPSGHPLTVIINCIVNSLYMRYCYHELNPVHDLTTFKRDVALITYGDDNAMGSRVQWFNHTSIAGILSTVGIKYTMAEKTAASVPFIDISEVTFLKRSFRWDQELKAYAAPLDEESIWKSMMIWVPSTTDSPQKQMLDIVRSAVSEWFFYGRERFTKEVNFLREMVNAAGLNMYVEKNTFLTWDQLSDRFTQCSIEYMETEPETSLNIIGSCEWYDDLIADHIGREMICPTI